VSEQKQVVAPSLRPSKQVEGGAASFDGTIVDVYVGQNNYNGQVQIPATGIYILLRNDEAGPDAKPRYADFFSAGKGTILTPTADGKESAEKGVGFLSARPDKPFQGLFKGSNALQLMEKFVGAGFKETDMNVDGNENNVTFLLGQRFHFALGELTKFEGQTGDAKPKMLPVKYLGKDAVVVSGGAAVAAGVVANSSGTGTFDAKAAASELVINALAGAENQTLTKQALTPLVSTHFKDPSQKVAVVKLLVSPAFLGGIEGVKMATDQKTLTLG
jgi:hypothetical protein